MFQSHEPSSPIRAGPLPRGPVDGCDHVTRDRQRNAVRYPDGTVAVQEREILTVSGRSWAPALTGSSIAPTGFLGHSKDLFWFIVGLHVVLAIGVAGGFIAKAVGQNPALGYVGALTLFWFIYVRARS